MDATEDNLSTTPPISAFTESWVARFGLAYNQFQPVGLSWFAGSAHPELHTLVVEQSLQRGEIVVDLGCGVGVEALFLAAQGMRVVGVDVSEDALTIARQAALLYGAQVTWIRGDILALPLAGEAADAARDCFVFHNLRDESRVLYAREVFRVLKPGGVFVMRGFSDRMTSGTGPRRLSTDDIIDTFLPGFECERLCLVSGLPTEKRPQQRHWLAIWRRRVHYREIP